MEEFKKKVIAVIKKAYNPDKTTVELSDLFDGFGITEKDLMEDHLEDSKESSYSNKLNNEGVKDDGGF